jgi:hypothetical protein
MHAQITLILTKGTQLMMGHRLIFQNWIKGYYHQTLEKWTLKNA